jgi:hypothetical protein
MRSVRKAVKQVFWRHKSNRLTASVINSICRVMVGSLPKLLTQALTLAQQICIHI